MQVQFYSIKKSHSQGSEIHWYQKNPITRFGEGKLGSDIFIIVQKRPLPSCSGLTLPLTLLTLPDDTHKDNTKLKINNLITVQKLGQSRGGWKASKDKKHVKRRKFGGLPRYGWTRMKGMNRQTNTHSWILTTNNTFIIQHIVWHALNREQYIGYSVGTWRHDHLILNKTSSTAEIKGLIILISAVDINM